MAATENVENMHDVALKPRLLRSLLREFVPDEKHPFRNPSDLSHVVSTVKTHRLLYEWAPPSTDQTIIDSWKSAVDSWVNRVLTLASNSSPDKCWAGICLLGVTCEECSSERFLASYSAWFNKLLSHIQPSADSHFVKAASCASLSDLFTRLSGYPNEKKDGSSQATKLIQPVLKLLNEDSSEAVWDEAVYLLCTVVNVFPSSVQRHYDSVESAIVGKMMSGKCSDSILKKFGHSLALLPKSRGDAESWSLMMQKILVSINTQLNDAFQGLEEETRRNKAMKLLLPPGKEPPPPLGGQTMSGENLGQAMKRHELLLMSRISTLMRCCCEMLTNTYPVQVSVPISSLIALAERVLMVDGSSSHALYPFLATMELEFICSELPLMHMFSLELLSSIVQGLRSLLLPYMADILRLLTEYFTRCTMPELRIKVYSITKVLLLSTGVGIVVYLTQEIINNAHLDLDSFGSESGRSSSSEYSVSAKALPQPRQKKRKHASSSGSLSEQSNRDGLDVGITPNLTSISVKIAALEALEALLTVGGALISESWRSNIDHLLMTVATKACKDGWVKEEENSVLAGKNTPSWADFQLAALRALLASLISPSRVRPRYLAQGLELFRKGTQERGTRVAEFCAHALSTLEVLIHPRGLPLGDFQSTNDNYGGVNQKFPGNMHFSGHKLNSGYYSGKLEKGPHEPDSDHDDPLENWLQSDEEMENPVSDLKKINRPEEASEAPFSEKLRSGDARHRSKDFEESELGASTTGASERVTADGGITSIQSGMANSGTGTSVHLSNDSDSVKNVVNKSHVMTPILEETLPAKLGKDALEVKNEAFNKIGEEVHPEVSNSGKNKGFVYESDSDSSMDSIPDIVDGDPDSD